MRWQPSNRFDCRPTPIQDKIIPALMVIALIVIGCELGYRLTLRWEVERVTGVVERKWYEAEECEYQTDSNGYSRLVTTDDEEYNVRIRYHDHSTVIDNRRLYRRYAIGDTLPVDIHFGYNKKKVVTRTDLTVPYEAY